MINKNATVSEENKKFFNQEIQKKVQALRALNESIQQKLNKIPTYMETPMSKPLDCEATINEMKALCKDLISELKTNKEEFVKFFKSFVQNCNLESSRFSDVVVISDSDECENNFKEQIQGTIET